MSMGPKKDPPWDTTIADLRKEVERLRQQVIEIEADQPEQIKTLRRTVEQLQFANKALRTEVQRLNNDREALIQEQASMVIDAARKVGKLARESEALRTEAQRLNNKIAGMKE